MLESGVSDNSYARDGENKPQDSIEISIPDGGYGWVIVIAAFFVLVFVSGNILAFGVFYAVFIDEFNSNKASVAWVGSIGAAMMLALGAWSGSLADRYGNSRMITIGACLIAIGYGLASLSNELWHLYLTLGLITGVGYSFAFISAVSVVGQWFTKRRGLALGGAVAGSGLGQFAMSMITGTLLTKYGWRNTLLILALINFVGLLICAVFIRRLLPLTKHDAISISQLASFQDRNFSLLFLGAFLHSLGAYMPYTHITVYSDLNDVSSNQAVFILSMVGISSAAGRLSLGWLADFMGKLFMLQICAFSSSIATFCWLTCLTFDSILAYGIVFGFFAGGVISLLPSVATEIVGSDRMGSIIGLLYSSLAIGNLLSAPIGGFLFDAYQSYRPPIIAAGCFMLVGLCSMLLVRYDPIIVLYSIDNEDMKEIEIVTVPDTKSNDNRGLLVESKAELPEETIGLVVESSVGSEYFDDDIEFGQ